MLKHVSFLTHDLPATLAFYVQLGGVVEKNLITEEGYRRAVVRLGQGLLQFFQIEGETSAPDLQGTKKHWAEHVALYVPDLRGLLPVLQAAGVVITRELQPSPSGRDMAFVADPDGRQVELLQADA
ncbi:VOC family protein [Deinococcus oregonensis]|uniref:VOC family protein n=1 Tax=Deinococcus oregonensis TaxID=1805970 RepID=A0ABV6B6K3_9DEIO